MNVTEPAGPFSYLSETLTSSERATLAFTNEGPVLGCPGDTSDAARDRAAKDLESWRRETQYGEQTTLVLPWPVDVTDIRR